MYRPWAHRHRLAHCSEEMCLDCRTDPSCKKAHVLEAGPRRTAYARVSEPLATSGPINAQVGLAARSGAVSRWISSPFFRIEYPATIQKVATLHANAFAVAAAKPMIVSPVPGSLLGFLLGYLLDIRDDCRDEDRNATAQLTSSLLRVHIQIGNQVEDDLIGFSALCPAGRLESNIYI